MVADAIELGAIERVLVVKLRHHGDVLLASPVLAVLKRQAPHLAIDALVYEDTADMLALHPALDTLHTLARRRSSGFARLREELALWRRLRARRYGLLVHLTEHPRGATLARTLGVKASVAPARSGKAKWWSKSFTHLYPLARNGTRHTVESNLDALRRIGVQPPLDARRLVLVAGAAAEATVDRLLESHRLEPGGFIHLHPASRWRFKCWPAASTAALIDALDAAGHRVVITAAPASDERRLVAEILAAARSRPVDLSGALSLKDLAALTARARLFVGVDSAPMHIAAAMGTPVVVAFGPSGEHEWGPWQVPHRVVVSNAHRCRPCGLDGCGGGKVSECLTQLPVGAMLGAARELLAETAR